MNHTQTMTTTSTQPESVASLNPTQPATSSTTSSTAGQKAKRKRATKTKKATNQTKNKLKQSQVLDFDDETQEPWYQTPMYDEYSEEDEDGEPHQLIECTKCSHVMRLY